LPIRLLLVLPCLLLSLCAGAAELKSFVMRIPGIGEHVAHLIIEHRPYERLDALLHVPGIGPKRFANLREWVRVER
jgi:DNA uptake protein ComE-like DNA-binding protein